MKDLKAMIFDIARASFVDGPGLRTTVFFKGCNLKCTWCHNPESQSFDTETMFFKDKCVGCGECQKEGFTECSHKAREICGRLMSTDEVLCEIIKDKIFYDTSGGGVTFSGGECMLNIDFLCKLLSKCKEKGIHTAVDTAGHVPFEYFERIMPYTDMFLYDIKLADEALHKKFTGVSNKLILENLNKLSENFSGDIIIRIPVIKGVNDTDEIKRIAKILKSVRYKEVELMPYHSMGEHKYAALGRKVSSFESISHEEEIKLYALFLQ